MKLYAVYAAGKPVKYLLSEDAGPAMEQMNANIESGNLSGQVKLMAEIPPDIASSLVILDEHQLTDELKLLVDQYAASIKLYRVSVNGYVVVPWTVADSEEEAIEKVKAQGLLWSASKIPKEIAAKIMADTNECYEYSRVLRSRVNNFIDLEMADLLDTE